MKTKRENKKCIICKNLYSCPLRSGVNQYLISTKVWDKRKFCSLKCSAVNAGKISSGLKTGIKQSAELIEKRIAPLRGRKRVAFSDEWIANLSKSHLGQVAWNKYKKFPERSGSAHHNWKGGISSNKRKLMVSIYWKDWRKSVFQRDGFKCVDCGVGGYLEPHHIIPVRSDRDKLFNTNNGITLCRPCHMKTFGKEIELASVYMTLASRTV